MLILAALRRSGAPSAPQAIGTLGDWRVATDDIDAPVDVVLQVNDLTSHADHAVQTDAGDRPNINRTLAPGILLIEGNGTDHLDAPQDAPIMSIGFIVYVPQALASERQIIGRDATTGTTPAFEITLV